MRPDRKVAAGGLSGALTTIVIWATDLAGVDMPAQVASAFVLVIMFAVSYLVPDRSDADGEAGETTIVYVLVGYVLMVVGLLVFRFTIDWLA